MERVASAAMRQLLLPMLAGMATTRQDALAFVHEAGVAALHELLIGEAEQIAGPKGRHQEDRTAHHWGTTRGELPFGGRRMAIDRPRVRGRDGREVALPSWRTLKACDPVPERVLEQILLGVSTRGYDRSLGPNPPGTRSRGASKSAASRHIVERTAATMRAQLSRRLDDVDLIGMFVDGIELAGHTVVVALGVTVDGTKLPLGLWLGSTENHVVCTALLNDLVERGLKIEHPILCVIDGGKGIRKALADVLGDRAVVQRCQVHKLRNVRDHLPESRKAYVARLMREAYRSANVQTARRRLKQLASWLETNGEHDAAASLREGLEETLTVLRLNLPRTLARTFSTTNPIENVNSTIRRVTRNVKRWRGGTMARRWVAQALAHAQSKFRRIKGHRDLHLLVRALRGAPPVDAKSEAA